MLLRCCCALASLVILTGCQTWSPRGVASSTDDEALNPTLPGQKTITDGVQRTGRFITGKEQVDRDRAVSLYREGDALFRQASEMPRDEASKTYVRAAKKFKRAREASPGSALQQDALFMAGESYFFANELTTAEDQYVTLQKEHPRSRHSDRAAARLFAIGKYWIDSEIAREKSMLLVNLTDDSRPWLDSGGNGIRVLDQMRYDDPTGKLADDATMAAAVEYMRNENWFEADQLFTDVREVFADSTHQFNAHKMGLRCKLEMYAGPHYSGLTLEEAEKLIERSKRLFPGEINQPENREFFENAEKMVTYLQAEKLWTRARYREKQGHYGGASEYLQEILDKYPMTPFADQAREHLAANAEKPQSPPQRLSFLTKLFPEGQPQKPLLGRDGRLLR